MNRYKKNGGRNMERNTIILAKYLFTKGVDLSSKIQKMIILIFGFKQLENL